MKKLVVALSVCVLAVTMVLAQAPQSFKYQAIARDFLGNVFPDKEISLRISILAGGVDGTLVYSETHFVTTNQFGLFTLEIGNGKNNTGSFSDIAWGTNQHFVKIEIDDTGGQNYELLGTSQLLSVPYALYAEKSGTSTSLSTGGKEANSWTEATGVTYLTNPNDVGIGTTLPDSKLHVIGTGINSVFERNISTTAGPVNRFYKSRGSSSSKTQIQAGDNMGQFQWWGMGDDGSYDIGATFKGVAESTRTGTDIFDVAASIQFLTTNTSFNWGERMRITADGNVGIGTTSPASILDIAGQYHFPNVDGSSGQVLRTDGSGNLTWQNTGASQIDDLSDGRTGGGSVFLGDGAGNSDDLTNNKNVALGINALNANITGDNNTAIGNSAMYHNTIGNKNTSNGTEALYYNTSGNLNTAIGYHTLYSNTGGTNNTALGETALFYNTTGMHNTALGSSAASFNSTGSNNTVVGRSANFYNRTGNNNTILGYQAGMGVYNSSFSGNIFLGYQAGQNETSDNKLYIENSSSSTPLIYGEFDNDLLRVNGTLHIKDQYQFPISDGNTGEVLQTNGSGIVDWAPIPPAPVTSVNGKTGVVVLDKTDVGLGNVDNTSDLDKPISTATQAALDTKAEEINDLSDGKTGVNSVFLGSGAGINNLGGGNVAVGIDALNANTSGTGNTANGYKALNKNTTGNWNTAYGEQALTNNTTGAENTAIGSFALLSNTTASFNSAFGKQALQNNEQGSENTALGYQALLSNTTGNGNTAVGTAALLSTTVGGNTGVGYNALKYNNTGYFNTALGYRALWMNQSGGSNIANGVFALYYNSTGERNVASGYESLYNNTIGNNNIGIGYGSNANNQEGSNNTIIGYEAGSGTSLHNKSGNVFLGYQAGYNETGSNKLCIENSNSTTPLIYGEFDNDIVAVNGDLGVGTTAPAEKLDVQGNIIASGTIRSGNSINIDGVNDEITATSGIISFDDEDIVTAGDAGIGTSNPDASAALEVASTSKGFLPPRMTSAQRNAIQNPTNGLQIFNIETNCINYYFNSDWYEVCGFLIPCTSPPTADAGTDETLCSGDCTNLTASGGVSYLWSQGSTTATINVCLTTTTTYTVTVADANGCTDTDEVTVTVNSTPVADAGSDITICPGACCELTSTGGTSYYWNTGATTATINVCPTTPTYTVTVTAANGCTDSDEVTVTLLSSFIDARDGTSYSTVQIGTQCWMAENLAYLPSVSPSGTGSASTALYYVMGYEGTSVPAAKSSTYYPTYGVLYNWTAAMAGAGSSNSVPSGVQGACPDGWHLPSDEEWKILEGEVDGTYDYPNAEWDGTGERGTDAACNLKEAGYTHWSSPNTNATNSSGFTALPGGARSYYGYFSAMCNVGYFWVSSESSSSNAWHRGMDILGTGVYRYDFYKKEYGLSVRCCKD